MTTNPESNQSHGEPDGCQEWVYHVSSTAAIGSLAIGVAFPGDGNSYPHLAEVVDQGRGTYAPVEKTIDGGSGKLVQVYSPEQWDEFIEALKRAEMSADLIV